MASSTHKRSSNSGFLLRGRVEGNTQGAGPDLASALRTAARNQLPLEEMAGPERIKVS